MDSNSVWVVIWSLVTTVVITLVVAISAVSVHNNNLDAALIKDGADPIRLRCMRISDMGRDPVCLIYLSKGAEMK